MPFTPVLENAYRPDVALIAVPRHGNWFNPPDYSMPISLFLNLFQRNTLGFRHDEQHPEQLAHHAGRVEGKYGAGSQNRSVITGNVHVMAAAIDPMSEATQRLPPGAHSFGLERFH